MQISVVIWRDAHSVGDSWITASESSDGGDYLVCTAGWLLDQTSGGKAGHVSIARSLTEDEYLDCVLHIPEQMVLRQIDLDEVTHDATAIERDEDGCVSADGVPTQGRGTGTV